MHTRLYKYLSKFSMISDDQFGFRRSHSTSMALKHIHTKIAESIDQNKSSTGIFNHTILLGKLDYFASGSSPWNDSKAT